jgi:hypothetical protein
MVDNLNEKIEENFGYEYCDIFSENLYKTLKKSEERLINS